jgi:hypothetical protein
LPRLLSTLLVLALLAGTAAAFAVTEDLKLEPNPILAPRIDNVFSPVCSCERQVAGIRFGLRRGDDLTVAVVDENNERVRTLVDSTRYPSGTVAVSWDGRDDAGQVVPEGTYRPRVRLADLHRTIVFPNEIEVDVTRPRVTLTSVRPRVFSPDGDGRRDGIAVRYRASEAAHGILYVNGVRRARGRWQRLTGQLQWYGRVSKRAFRAGTYRVSVAVRDLAGNLSDPSRPDTVRVRYVDLRPRVVRTFVGVRFRVRVDTDAAVYRWRVVGGTGVGRRGLLAVRAPGRPGRYVLYVEANGRADRTTVIVRRRQ